MKTALNAVLDVALAGSLLFFLGALVNMVATEKDRTERMLMSLALVAGAVIAVGAQVSDVSFATFTVNSLIGVRPGGGAFKAVAVIVPGGLAATFGWYFIRVMRKSTVRGRRLMALLGMLTLVGFVEIYAQATATKGVVLGVAAIPNASFVAGLIISLLFFMPEPNPEPGLRTGRLGPDRRPHSAAGSSARRLARRRCLRRSPVWRTCLRGP